jgi:hypothetical protein
VDRYGVVQASASSRPIDHNQRETRKRSSAHFAYRVTNYRLSMQCIPEWILGSIALMKESSWYKD